MNSPTLVHYWPTDVMGGWAQALAATVDTLLADVEAEIQAKAGPDFERLHPRNPKGHVGGGEFRSIYRRITDALDAWAKTDRKGDPFKEFQDREPLRLAAGKRGISVPRNASRDHIAELLKADLQRGGDKSAVKAVKKAAPKKAAPSVDPKLVREVEVDNRIRKAYRTVLARQPNTSQDFVGLADVRDELGEDLPRGEVDDALRRMARADYDGPGKPRVIPIANTKALMQRDRDSVVRIGDSDAHAISFADPSDRPVPGAKKATPRGGRRASGALDPVETYKNDGEAGLREQLSTLDPEQLRDIVAENGMDPAGTVMRWRDKQRVIDRIVDLSGSRSTKGQAFRPPAKKAAPKPGVITKAPTPAVAKKVAPGKAAPKSTKGSDLVGRGDSTALADSILATATGRQTGEGRFGEIAGPHGDEVAFAIAERQGFDGPPRLVSAAEFDRLVAAGHEPFYRGISKDEGGIDGEQFAERLRAGDAYIPTGIWGSGIYTSRRLDIARRYGPNPLRMTLGPDARVVDWPDLKAEHQAFLAGLDPDSDEYRVFSDQGRYAAARGYDAMRVPGSLEDEVLVFNRSALIVREPGGRVTKAPRVPAKKAAPTSRVAKSPAEILAGLDPNLTPGQKRARLRARGVSVAEIDALVPLKPRSRVKAAAGHDITPGHDELHHYWTRGEGLAKWASSPAPWTTLVALLTRHVGPEKAKVYASRWFYEHFHFYAGSDLNRVTHGHPPRGHLVGPG